MKAVLRYIDKKRTARNLRTVPVPYVLEELLLLCVSLIEFVNATCSVDELHLTCVEWVRCVRDLKFYYWVFNALDLDGLLSVRARAGNEHLVVLHILESYKTVGFGMDSCFHNAYKNLVN